MRSLAWRPLGPSWIGLLAHGAVLLGCEPAEPPASAAGGPTCRMAQEIVTLPEQITEASGVAVSNANSGTIWTHNDSGGEPALFALDAAGQIQGQVRVTGAEMDDWEDLAIGPCQTGDCLYIADIGDNSLDRSSIYLYRVPEPVPGAAATEPAERFEMRYPDGPRNSEALFVLPPERIFIVTKGDDGQIELFAYPGALRSGEAVELESVRTLSRSSVPLADRVTGASADARGVWVAIRTYTSVLFYPAEAFVDGTEVEPRSADLGAVGEMQGEGLALADNGAIVLVGEGSAGSFPGSMGMIWCDLLDPSDQPEPIGVSGVTIRTGTVLPYPR